MVSKSVALVFPNQLFKNSPLIGGNKPVVLVEEGLFFRQYNFHKQKLVLHRASMQFYKRYLNEQNILVEYIECTDERSDVRRLVEWLAGEGVREIHYIDVVDDWLGKRLVKSAQVLSIHLEKYATPNFLNTIGEVKDFFSKRKSYFQTDFYKWQRVKRNILLLPNGQPEGGQWSYDADNRKRIPKKEILPLIDFPAANDLVEEARQYVDKNFAGNCGTTEPLLQSNRSFYPVTFREAEHWLQDFLSHRFARFGIYEDAMVKNESFLFHGVLTPALNIGLLTPQQVVDEALQASSTMDIPLNSVEGFIRQVTGWREYIRSLYELEGSKQRTRHFWNFKRRIPASFREGTTGIVPVDTVIKRVLKTGYSHHIERLMVMGNFMFLCEFDPDEVYRWFMEMYIDAYDWVMVPNVYGMTQFADGGLMMTKPYISGSNYILKMSDYEKGEWQEIWDGLFWRFMHVHRDVMVKNQRLGMLLRTFDKWPEEKRLKLINNAEKFLNRLDGENDE